MKNTIEEILAIIASLKEIENISGDEISEKIVKLAVLKSYVGQSLAKMDYNCAMAEAMRKQEWNNAFCDQRLDYIQKSNPSGIITKPKNIKESEIGADMEVADMLKKEIEERRKLTLLKNLREDCETVIVSCQSRLNQLKSEMVEAKS